MFVSCSEDRSDRKVRDALLRHLRILERQQVIEIFNHDVLPPGALWRQETTSRIERAAAAILFISPTYLDSPELMEDQLPRLLEQAQARGAAILPLLLEPSMFFRLPHLACFKPFNPGNRTIIRMGAAERKEFLLGVAEDIDEIIRRQLSGGDIQL